MVRCGDMLRQLSDDLPRLSERMAAASPFEFVGLAATWVAADVDRITVLLRETGRPMLVLETRRDYPLVDVTEAVGKTVHYRGASYLPARDGWFVGRVGANAFCATGDEESMCLLLERLIEGEAGNIRGDLARALSNCTAFEQLVVCWVGCESREETPGWATPGSVLLQIALSGQCAVSLNARLAFTEERYTANVAFELQELVKGSGATEIEQVESRGNIEDGGPARETSASVDASGGVVQISTRCSLDTFLKQVPPLSGMVSTHALASGISSAARRVFEAQVQQVVQGTDK